STPRSISAWLDSDCSSSGRAMLAAWLRWRAWREGIQPQPPAPIRNRSRADPRVPRPAVVGHATVPRRPPRFLRLLPGGADGPGPWMGRAVRPFAVLASRDERSGPALALSEPARSGLARAALELAELCPGRSDLEWDPRRGVRRCLAPRCTRIPGVEGRPRPGRRHTPTGGCQLHDRPGEPDHRCRRCGCLVADVPRP